MEVKEKIVISRNFGKSVKIVYCVMKENDDWKSSNVTLFTSRALALEYINRQQDPNIYTICQRELFEKIF